MAALKNYDHWLLIGLVYLISFQVVASDTKDIKALIADLQKGGHILYFRHAATDGAQKDLSLKSCRTQRNLSEKGRLQAKLIGRNVTQLNIPIDRVISSPYCRTKETAKLAFGQFEVDENLAFSMNRDKLEMAQLAHHLRTRMSEVDLSKGNIVFVGHTSNLRGAVQVWPRPEGVLAVFSRSGEEIVFKGFIKPNEWPID